MNARWLLWIALLGIAAWLAVFGDKSPGAVVQPTSSRPAARAAARPSAAPVAGGRAAAQSLVLPVARETLFERVSGEGLAKPIRRDPFSARSWAPPPEPAAVATPTAPPVPYVFLGKKLEAGSWEVYLGRGDQTFVAREGQVLEGLWRLEKIAPPSLALTYLPLGQEQALAIGESR